MILALHIQASIIPIIMLLVIFLNVRSSSASLTDRLFSHCVLLIVIVLGIDLIAWALEGAFFSGSLILLYIVNAASFILGVCISFEWFRYSSTVTLGDSALSKKQLYLIMIPGLLFILLICINLIMGIVTGNGLIFAISPAHTYARSALFFLYILVSFGYLIAACSLALARAKTSPTRSMKNEFYLLASFVFLPIVGAIIQTFVYGLSLVWTFAALSILVVYIGRINQNVSLDSLTGLNNRGQFDKILTLWCNNPERTSAIQVAIIDVNDFKQVNDTYGHVLGDKVLQIVASALKRTFSSTDALIARYGGDEFAVIMQDESQDTLRTLLYSFNSSIQESTKEYFSKPLTVSFGVASFEKDSTTGIEQFVASADAKMYEQKQNYRRGNHV